jgi:two-component system sensor histidine kinase DesK
LNTFKQSIADGNKPYWMWGSLIYTSFYFLPTIGNYEHIALTDMFYILSIFIAFIFLYRKAVYAKGTDVIPLLIMMTLVAAFGTYFTVGTQALFGYVAFISGFNLTFRKSLLATILLSLVIILTGYLLAISSLYFYLPALTICCGLYIFGCLTQRDVKHQIKESHSQQQIEQLATIAERERIARDLHDVIGHSLSSIALKAELADKYIQLKDQENAAKEIKAVAAMSRKTLAEVRQAVSGLKRQDLATKFKTLVAALTHQNIQIETTYVTKKLSATIESTLILILTEAVTNIMRHSNATKVNINLLNKNQQVQLDIIDNGICSAYDEGNGLMGIKERCLQLNGNVNITTNNGFALHVNLPIQNNL